MYNDILNIQLYYYLISIMSGLSERWEILLS